jgi:hypothetical protein
VRSAFLTEFLFYVLMLDIRSTEEKLTELFKGLIPRLHTLVIGPG